MKNIIINKLQNFLHGFTLLNLSNTELRKNRSNLVFLSQIYKNNKDYEIKSDDQDLNMEIENQFLLKELHDSIDKLPENHKSVIILRDIQGLSYDDISNILDVPLGTIKSRINRARLQLQVSLKNFKRSDNNGFINSKI